MMMSDAVPTHSLKFVVFSAIFQKHIYAIYQDLLGSISVVTTVMDSHRQGHRGKIRAPGQRRHGPSHIEQSRAHIMLTMLTLGALPGP